MNLLVTASGCEVLTAGVPKEPEEIEAPIYSGWLVPWSRNSVSLPLA